MCRLFGLSSAPRRTRATFWLLDAPDSLSRQSHREPDGTGLGRFTADGVPRVDKAPIAAYEDRAFAEEARRVESATFVAHIRYASTGGLDARNTHPFEQDGRLFAHNGVIEGLDRLDAHLGDDRSLVRGDTDSERFFALITRETRNHGGSHGRMRVHSETLADRRAVVVASERMDDHPGWRLLEPGELLHVGPGPKAAGRVVLTEPPVHRLTLDDLRPDAAASQRAV
ncbi:class II glutamine amidotransferase [Streptomyces sp. PD-S100-1]|uniref:class II glutamine amidotransferase n=1 Tax=Streptomyces sp. PD-S100-1 TaxID=3394351 RepID=UPI0039BD1CCC